MAGWALRKNDFQSLLNSCDFIDKNGVFISGGMSQTQLSIFVEKQPQWQAWIYIFLTPDRLSSRNDVMSDKVNVRPDITQNFFFFFLKKIMTWRVCVALKTIWSYQTLININLMEANVHQHPVVFKEHLVTFPLTFFAYASKLKLVSAIFYQIFILYRMITFFISSKKLFSFSRYSDFSISVFPSFSPGQPLL